jgi:hypothetical protein
MASSSNSQQSSKPPQLESPPADIAVSRNLPEDFAAGVEAKDRQTCINLLRSHSGT